MIMLTIIIRIRIIYIYIYMDIHTQSYAYSKPKLFSGGLPEYPNLIWLISSFDSAKNLGLYCSWPWITGRNRAPHRIVLERVACEGFLPNYIFKIILIIINIFIVIVFMITISSCSIINNIYTSTLSHLQMYRCRRADVGEI